MSDLVNRLRALSSRAQNLQPVANTLAQSMVTARAAVHQFGKAAEIVAAGDKRVSFNEQEPFDFAHRKITDVVIGEDFLETDEPQRHNENFIHVSDLSGICPRAYVLAVRHKARYFKEDHLSRFHRASTRVTWVQGRATEEHIRAKFIKRFGKQVFGTWECPCKQSRYLGFQNESLTCSNCRSPHRFFETPIFDHSFRMVGTADLPVWDASGLVFVELKSIKKEDFEALEGPTPAHLNQVFTYRDMAVRNGFGGKPISDHVCVIYASKEFSTKSAYKEYYLNVHDEQYEHVWATANLIKSKATIIRDSIQARTLPPKIVKCQRDSCCATAKNCPMYVNCMSQV